MHKQDMVIHAMKYVSKKKEILIHATRCMNLEDIMLSEISQSQNNEYRILHLYEVRAVTKLMKIESRMVIAKGRR